MTEVAHAGKNHGYFLFIHRLDDFFITNGAAWLNDRRYPGTDCRVNAIAKREERIRRHHTAFNGQIGFHLCQLD